MKHTFISLAACGLVACGDDAPDPRILAHAAGCSGPEGQPVIATASVVLMSGSWVRCSGPSLLGVDQEAGILIEIDGTYTALLDENGTPVPETGPDYSGPWQIYKGDFYYYSAGGGQHGTPSFEHDPWRLTLVLSETSERSIYAIDDDVPTPREGV
jgi:hypothetical protein